jgi:segregation and condensation protein A
MTDRESRSDSETRTESEASREREDDQRESSEGRAAQPRDGDTDDDIPLNIAGHDERKARREGQESTEDLLNDDTDGSESAESPADEEEPAEPVEVLVQLAKDNEIDPWDIDVVQVTDKFLDRIDGGDLRTGGRALFYASVLVRMKSDAMLGEDEPEEPEPEPWEQRLEGGEQVVDGPDPFAALEAEMDRRLERKRARGMPQTLDELVRDLRAAERDSYWKESREYDTSGSPRGFQRGTQELDYHTSDDLRREDEPSQADVTGTAHGEDIEEVIESVHSRLRDHYEAGRAEVLYAEVADAGGSRVESFLALLFLAHRGQVRLQQDDLFGDLWVQDPAADHGQSEAVAD